MHVCCIYMYKCMYKFYKFEKKEKSIVKQKLSNIQYIRVYIHIPSRLTLLTPMKTRTNVARDTVLPSPGKIKRSKGRKKNHLLEGRKKTLGIDKRVDRKREREKMEEDGAMEGVTKRLAWILRICKICAKGLVLVSTGREVARPTG